MRTMFGVDAFPLFTMDKLLSVLVKHLIALIQDASSIVTFNLFKAFISRRALLTSERQQDNEELVYEFLSASALSDSTCIKSTALDVGHTVVTFEMIDPPMIRLV